MTRIDRWMAALSAAGAIAAWAGWGWRAAAAFLIGALASWLNYRWLKRIVNLLGGAPQPVRPLPVVLYGLRYALLGLGGYVIVKYSTLSLTAGLIGLFVPVAAVLLEILFELVYAP